MLIDACKAELLSLLLLQVYPVKVFPVSLICHQAFGFSALCASFQVKFVAKHTCFLELNCVFHETEHYRSHASALDRKHAEYFTDQRERVVQMVIDVGRQDV